VLSDALASQSLGQLVENYDDPVYSAAERLIVADCPPSRPSALHPDVAAAVASSPVASRQPHRHRHVAAASQPSERTPPLRY